MDHKKVKKIFQYLSQIMEKQLEVFNEGLNVQ